MAAVVYPCACQREQESSHWRYHCLRAKGWLQKCPKVLYSLIFGVVLSEIALSTLCTDQEEKARLSVAVFVMNELQERLVLQEISMCGDRSWKEWKKEYAL